MGTNWFNLNQQQLNDDGTMTIAGNITEGDFTDRNEVLGDYIITLKYNADSPFGYTITDVQVKADQAMLNRLNQEETEKNDLVFQAEEWIVKQGLLTPVVVAAKSATYAADRDGFFWKVMEVWAQNYGINFLYSSTTAKNEKKITSAVKIKDVEDVSYYAVKSTLIDTYAKAILGKEISYKTISADIGIFYEKEKKLYYIPIPDKENPYHIDEGIYAESYNTDDKTLVIDVFTETDEGTEDGPACEMVIQKDKGKLFGIRILNVKKRKRKSL